VSRATVDFKSSTEEVRLRADFDALGRLGVADLRRRTLTRLPALERRRMAYPKAQDYAVFKVALQQRSATGEMGFNIDLRCKKS
jgi:hypothetical protein